MRKAGTIIFSVIFGLLFSVSMAFSQDALRAGFPRSIQSENKVPGWVESTARRLANGLRQQGYQVARGYFKLYTQADCPSSYSVLRSCLGNNPAAPYILPVVPSWPDEWVDPATVGMVGPTVEGYSLTQFGFDNIEDFSLAGSADAYDGSNHGKLFLQYFARDCTGLDTLTAGSHCYSVGDQMPYCYDTADLTCDMLVLSVRNYILPGAQRGPEPLLTLSPRLIPLQRPQRR